MLTTGKHGRMLVLAATAAFAWMPQASAANPPTGIWLDHTGRAAVEISDCAGKLCGKLVWFKDPANNAKGCNLQIIGDVRPVSNGKWDGGWILDPEKDSKYDVEITPLGPEKLRVMGYAGMKFLSETFTWTRAAPDLQRCDKTAERSTPQAPNAEPGVPFNPPSPPPGNDPAAPQPGAIPGPGPSTGPGTAPPAPPGMAPQRKTAKKNCTFEVPVVNVKVTVPCDEDE